MTKLRTGDPWMPAPQWGAALQGLTMNFIVRDVMGSLAFYRDLLGMTVLYADVDFGALEIALGSNTVRFQLHADHTYDQTPWAEQLATGGRRGLGAEVRLLGIDPDSIESRARQLGYKVVVPAGDRPYGWRDVAVEDREGYTFYAGIVKPLS